MRRDLMDGSMTIVDYDAADGLYAARDKMRPDAAGAGGEAGRRQYCASFESSAFINLGLCGL